MTTYDSILAAASLLPPDDRFRLIEDLWGKAPTSLSAEWHTEVERRSQEIDNGEVTLVDWTAVRDAALKRVGIKGESST